MKELKLVEKFKKLPQAKSVILGPGDDAAVIKTGNKYLLFCGDMLIEDTHFKLKECKFQDLGHRAVARALSDIAAMSGVPEYIGVSLAMPDKYSNKVLDILQGIRRIAKQFKLSIIGGDLSRSKKIFLDVWCLGCVERNKLTRRAGAKNNDGIFVSGKLGSSFKNKVRFIPKIREARILAKKFKIHSMIDISDGLVLDLYRIIHESKKQAILFQDNIPLNPGASLRHGLFGGEDYELLFTTSLKNRDKLQKMGFYFIGIIKNSQKPIISINDQGGRIRPLKIKGYFAI